MRREAALHFGGTDQFGRLRKRDDAIEILSGRYRTAARTAAAKMTTISSAQNRKCRYSTGGAAISDLESRPYFLSFPVEAKEAANETAS
jgi:hypothetical protein